MKYCCKDMMLAIGSGDLSLKYDGVGIVCKLTYNMPIRFCPYCGRKLEFKEESNEDFLNGMDYCTTTTTTPASGEIHTYVSQNKV